MKQSPTALVAQEGGIMKWMSNPNDLSIFLSAGAEGTHVRLSATWEYGKATGKLLQPVLQGKVNKIRERISHEIGGVFPTPPPLPRPAAPEPIPVPPAPLPSPSPGADRIFISYRRSDSPDVTGRIHERLVAHFGEGNVFQDVEDIPLGMDFAENIQEVVGKCDAFLAIIGDKWIDAADKDGGRRLDNPADYTSASKSRAHSSARFRSSPSWSMARKCPGRTCCPIRCASWPGAMPFGSAPIPTFVQIWSD